MGWGGWGGRSCKQADRQPRVVRLRLRQQAGTTRHAAPQQVVTLQSVNRRCGGGVCCGREPAGPAGPTAADELMLATAGDVATTLVRDSTTKPRRAALANPASIVVQEEVCEITGRTGKRKRNTLILLLRPLLLQYCNIAIILVLQYCNCCGVDGRGRRVHHGTPEYSSTWYTSHTHIIHVCVLPTFPFAFNLVMDFTAEATLDGLETCVPPAIVPCGVYVTGLNKRVTRDVLLAHFSTCGEVFECTFSESPRQGFAWLRYCEQSCADLAVRRLHHSVLLRRLQPLLHSHALAVGIRHSLRMSSSRVLKPRHLHLQSQELLCLLTQL